MPSSVKDRLTNAHEHVFLLTKKAKYFYDADAISEDAKYAEQHAKKATSWGHKKSRTNKNNIEKYQAIGIENNRTCLPGGKRNKRDTWTIPTRPGQWEFCYGCHSVYEGKDRRKIIKDGRTKTCPNCGSTDKWVEHFAMFPSDLVSPCILAGTSAVGCCPKCGSPWRRVVEKTGGRDWRNDRMKSKGIPGELAGDGSYKRGQLMEPLNNVKISTTICWEPSCSCFSKGDEPLPDPVPCTVLDPFSGAGTTGVVAAMNGRRFIGIDVKEEYAALSRARVEKVAVKHSLEVTSPFQ
jgi:DNA modification methylase